MFAARNAFQTGAKIITPVTFSAYTNSATTSVTLPTHAVGNIIVMMASSTSNLPTAPSASGTVPTWTTIRATGYFDGLYPIEFRVAYAIATATNHTSGTWTGANRLIAAVFSGNRTSSPIGANAFTGSDAPSSAAMNAPAITLTDTAGTSAIVQFWTQGFIANFSSTTVPSGYTKRFGGFLQMFSTKDITTSDGVVNITGPQSIPWGAVQFEILAAT